LQSTTAALSDTSLRFGVELVGTHSTAQTVTLTNTGPITLNISSITASGDFVQRNNCGSSLPAGESCTIKVAFMPSAKGVRTGRVTITDDAADSPQIIKLKGIGTVVQVSPSALNFGDQVVGTTSDPLTATVTNIGSEGR
jgi:Abnormal spindle-like microcephaly-assoc'd, ASPM-SPD-2-Hydin